MAQPPVVARAESTLEDVARLMLERRIGCVPVVDAQDKLQGIVTESNFMMEERYVPFSAYQSPQLFGQWVSKGQMEQIYALGRTLTAADIMRSPVVVLHEHDSVQHAAELMLRHDVHHLPVVRDGTPVGIVSRHDLLRVMVRDGTPG
jgi:CBS domain-containing protein